MLCFHTQLCRMGSHVCERGLPIAQLEGPGLPVGVEELPVAEVIFRIDQKLIRKMQQRLAQLLHRCDPIQAHFSVLAQVIPKFVADT
jgi:hypothetical protein